MTLIQLLAESQVFLVSATAILGLIVGSFLNVVIYRLPLMLQQEWRSQCREFLGIEATQGTPTPAPATFNLIKPDSHCPACQSPVKPWHNVPVLSYLMLRGRCANCKTAISLRYPLIEAASGLVAAVVAFAFGFQWYMLAALILVWCLLVLTLIDLDHQLLPDNITLPLLWLGLLVSLGGIGPVSLQNAVLGAIAGYGVLWTFYWAFKLLTGKEGMGYGDFKMLGALGAWLGWQSLLPLVILSSLGGALIGITLVLFRKRDRSVPIPFGPYLALAGFIMLIWGPQIADRYFFGAAP